MTWLTNSLLLKMAIEIVDFPIKNGDLPWFFVCLPEGIMTWLMQLTDMTCSDKSP